MKVAVAAFVFIGAIICANAGLAEEQRKQIEINGKACVAESGVETEVILKARKGTFGNDPKMKAYTFCLSRKFGIQNEAGEILVQPAQQVLTGALNDPNAARKVVESCLAKGNKEDVALETFKCYYKHLPSSVVLF